MRRKHIKTSSRRSELASQKSRLHFGRKSRILLTCLMVVFLGGFVAHHSYGVLAEGQSIDSEIDKLVKENVIAQTTIDRLKTEATSYEDAITRMQDEITDLEAKLQINNKEQERLNGEIKLAEADLKKQREVLGGNLSNMYIEGDFTVIEMLASSNNLSEFFDKQQYRSSVMDKITETLNKINRLKHQLKGQKETVDKLVKEQNVQREKLALSKNEQAQLLAMNQGQQSEFGNKIKANADKLKELIAQQGSFNLGDGSYYFVRIPGAIKPVNPLEYEYRDAGHNQEMRQCVGPPETPDFLDRWGYCTRQCVSYAAWAVVASGREAPKYWGNAKNWIIKAAEQGVPVYRTPEPGDIAISTSGYWGHAMYVESVKDNTFTTTEYNTKLDGNLYYRTRVFQ